MTPRWSRLERGLLLLEEDFTRRSLVRTVVLRTRLAGLGFDVRPGVHPVIPIIVGDEALAIQMSRDLLEEGVYVSGFGFPVVPRGEARLRVQVSAALTREDMDRALEAFEKVGRRHRILGTDLVTATSRPSLNSPRRRCASRNATYAEHPRSDVGLVSVRAML